MAYLQQRGNKLRAKVRIPKLLRSRYNWRELIERTLESTDRLQAKAEAGVWEAGLRAEWAATQAVGAMTPEKLRAVYEDARRAARGGEYAVEIAGEDDPLAAGIELEIDKIAERLGPEQPEGRDEARL